MTGRRRMVDRDVRVDDPDLSPDANERLTAELRAAVGADHVSVPEERSESLRRIPPGSRRTLGAQLGANRMLIAVSFGTLLVLGLILTLVTGSWWAVVGACAAHATATLLVATVALRLSTEVEHVAAETAARLEAEGVADPDRALGDLVALYSRAAGERGTAEAVSSGHNQRTTSPADDPLAAGSEQRTAMTPSSEPSTPTATRVALLALPILAVAGSLALGVVAAAIFGGVAWIGALLLLGAAVAWSLLEVETNRNGGGHERAFSDDAAGRRGRLIPTIVIVGAAVVAGVIVVGAVAGYL